MDYKNFTVILPTLNEAGAIGQLLAYLEKHYAGISVVVADDGSADGTIDIARKAALGDRRIRIIDRKRLRRAKGLTASAIDGIMLSRTKFAIVMDADMQHPPAVIRDIAALLVRGDRLVVASRASVEGWALNRKVVSKLLIWLGYAVLAIRGSATCNDIFSGYFGVDRALFLKVYSANRRRFVTGGYKILFDFLKCMPRRSIRMRSVPFAFQTRKTGRSKAGAGQAAALLRSFVT